MIYKEDDMQKSQSQLCEITKEAADAAGNITTFGWDTTFTTNYAVMNNAIRTNSSFPPEFDNTANIHEILDYLSQDNEQSYYQLLKQNYAANSSSKIKGKWGQWQLEKEGSGRMVFLRLPVTSGSITFGEETGDLAGGCLYVKVDLTIVDQSANGEAEKILTLKMPKQKVVVQSAVFPGIDPDSDLSDLVRGAFERYLNTQRILDQFRYVFSTVSVNDKATGDFAWLKPSDTGYAVSVPQSASKEEDCLFSVLCMTGNTKASSLNQWAVDNQVFVNMTKGTDAVLCISPQKLCEKILITAATKIIVGSSASDYEFSTDGMQIHNKKQINFKDVEVSKGDKVDLKIEPFKFSLELKHDFLELQLLDASYEKSMYTAYINITQTIAFDVARDKDKTYFKLREGEEFKGRLHVTVEPTEAAEILKWVGIGIDIVASLLAIGGLAAKAVAKCTTTAASAVVEVANATVEASEVADATAAAISGIEAGAGASRALTISSRLLTAATFLTAIGLPFSLVETIAVAIGTGKFEKVPSIENFANNLLSSFTWNNISNITLVGARLNSALLLDFKMEK